MSAPAILGDLAALLLELAALVGVYRTARRAVAVWAPFATGVDRFLATAICALALVVCSGQLLGFAGALAALPWLALALVPWALLARLRPAPAGDAGASFRGLGAGLAPVALALLALAVLGGRALVTVPVDWDGLSYHLFFPAQYLQEGRIVRLDLGRPIDQATFYPQNAELTYAFLMAFVRSDLLVALSMVAWTAAAGVATGRLAHDLGASPPAAAVAGALAATVPALVSRAASSYVEPLLVFATVTALLFARRALAATEAGARVAAGALSGLAIGVAAGTKFTALPLLAALGGMLAVALAARRAGAARGRTLAAWSLGAALPAAAWYVRNGILAGNPLYPAPLFSLPYLDRVDLRWHGSTPWAMRARLDEMDLFGDALFGLPPDRRASMTLGPVVLLALLLCCVAGAWLVPRVVARLRAGDPSGAIAHLLVPAGLLVGIVGWLATPFWFNIGLFRSLVRTATPTAALALALGVGVLERWRVKPVWIAAGGALAVVAQLRDAGQLALPDRAVAAAAAALLLLAAWTLGAGWRGAAAVDGRLGPRRRRAAGIGFLALLAVAWLARENGRGPAWLANSPQRIFASAALAAERLAPGAARVVFASDLNFEFLYLFQGRRLERRVLHLDPARFATAGAWQAAVAASGADLVVVSRWLAPTKGWPPEEGWARELGLPLAWESEQIRIFRATPPVRGPAPR